MHQEIVKAALILSGFNTPEKALPMYRIENEYLGFSLDAMKDDPDLAIRKLANPWWLVLSEHGPIKIGLRKRVYEISWEGTPLRVVDDNPLTQDDVTKAATYVHAEMHSSLVDYLTTLRIRLDAMPTTPSERSSPCL